MCLYVRVFMCTCVYVCLLCYSDVDLIVRSEPSNRRPRPDPDSCSQSTDMPRDLKTDARDNSEIRTDSCSEDQTAIRIQNRVISCECLLLCYYLFIVVNSCCMITRIISCERLAYFISIVKYT